MTKLEEKLIELGYKQFAKIGYEKFCQSTRIVIGVNSKTKEIYGKIKDNFNYIDKDYQINELVSAFNIMQKDLEVLKEYESA